MPSNNSTQHGSGSNQTRRRRFEPSFRSFLGGEPVAGDEGKRIEEVLRASLLQMGNNTEYDRTPDEVDFPCYLHDAKVKGPSTKWEIEHEIDGKDAYTLCTDCFVCVTDCADSVAAALHGAQLEGEKVVLENVKLPVDGEATIKSTKARTQELHQNCHWENCDDECETELLKLR